MKTSQSNCFIIQTSNNELWYFFYSTDGNICYSLYSNKHWANPVNVIKNVSYNFSVNLANNKDIYIFCQDLIGNVILCLYQNESWSFKKILENKSSDIYDINFQMIFNKESLNLIYSMPIVGEKNAQLVYHSMANSKWSSPQILDNIIPFRNIPFVLQKINDNLYLVFYERHGRERSLGYREFSTTLKKWSKFNPVNANLCIYLDESFLATEDTIHALYIVKGNFSCQLVYKYKRGSEWSSPKVLYESNRIDACSLFILGNQLWAMWYMNSSIYTCISQNMGKTFSKASRYQGQYINLPSKALFMTNINQKEEKLYLREILLYAKPMPEILLIPELYPDFYSISSCSQVKTIHKKSEESKIIDGNLEQHMSILKNKISICERELSEKESQISKLIKEKNLLSQAKSILENQIADQSIEISLLQRQLEEVKRTSKSIILPTGIPLTLNRANPKLSKD